MQRASGAVSEVGTVRQMDRGGRGERLVPSILRRGRGVIPQGYFRTLKVRGFRESGWHHGYVYIRP